MKHLLLSLLLLAGNACASDWTEADTTRQAAVLTTFALDYAQTKDIKNHQGMYEVNPIMGKHPSDGRITTYFLAASVAHTAVAYSLKPEWRKAFQYSTIVLEAVVIARNKKIGLKFNF